MTLPARYLESYGQGDDDDYLPVIWDDLRDDIGLPGEVIRPLYFMYFDRMSKTWRCDCPRWRRTGQCFHAYRFRGEEILEVNEKYL